MSTDAPDFERELATQVLNLRRGGASFDMVAERLNLTPKAAKALFDKALGTYDPEFQRALEGDRMDKLHMAVWPQAVKGDLNAVDRVIRISERRERVLATPKENTHDLRTAFDRSAETSTQIIDGLDDAILAAGRKIADRVDEAVAGGDGQEVTKALYLLPHMVNVLRECLATPASRNTAKLTGQEKAPGKLAELRAIHGPKKTG